MFQPRRVSDLVRLCVIIYVRYCGGNCTRVNLYNRWATSVPDDSRHADGDNSGLSATVLSVKGNEILSTPEITFTYSAP